MNSMNFIIDPSAFLRGFDNKKIKLKEYMKVEKEKDAYDRISYTDSNPIVIKARFMKAKMDFFIEFADTFSWYSAVLLKMSRIIEAEGLDKETKKKFDIEETLKKRYDTEKDGDPLHCYACNMEDCGCLFYPDSSQQK